LSNTEELQKILEDSELARVFWEHLHELYSNENLSFWMAVEEYKKLQESSERQREKCQEIFKKYFDKDSIYEVNIDADLRRELEQSIENPDANTFNKAQKAVWMLMAMDSYPRFINSELYKNYVAAHEKGAKTNKKEKDKSRLRNKTKSDSNTSRNQLINNTHTNTNPKLVDDGWYNGLGDNDHSGRNRSESLIMLENFLLHRPLHQEVETKLRIGDYGKTNRGGSK